MHGPGIEKALRRRKVSYSIPYKGIKMTEPEKKCGKRPDFKPLSVEDARKSSEHLHYEINMLISTAQSLAKAQQVLDQTQFNLNVLLESFVIHARALMDFMYDDKPWEDDVVAAKFFDSPKQWTKVRKPLVNLSEELQKVNGRVGKEVAHLTLKRNEITAETKKWQFGKIAQELKTSFDIFLEHVPKDKLNSSIWRQMDPEGPAFGGKLGDRYDGQGRGATGPTAPKSGL